MSEQRYKVYLEEHDDVSQRAELLQEATNEITKRADFDLHTKKKKVSAYRVFKKEIAEQVKQEFPKMNNSERQMIVKERWRSLENEDKGIYVLQARFVEEKK